MGLSTFDTFKTINTENNPNLKVLTDKELHQLQAALLDMLVDLDLFFQSNQIRYSLAGGSALGVIRHGGFIPWDDDVDLLMPRMDYDKFRKIFQKKLGEKYWLHTPENTDGYGLGFARIRKKGTVCRSRDDIHNEECGVYIDIFIMENTYDSSVLRKMHGLLSMFCGFAYSCRRFLEFQDLNLSLVQGNPEAEKIFNKKIFFGKLFAFKSLDGWTRTWNKVNSMCRNTTSKYVTVPSGRRHFFKEMYDRKWACEMKRCDFTFDGKKHTFSLMKGARFYLKKMYGDYMKLPNPEDIEKHVVLELKL